MGTIDEVADRFEAAKHHLRQPINHVLPPSVLLYIVPPLPSVRTLVVLLALSLLVALRIWYILPSRKPHPVKSTSNAREDGCTVGVFLGSGGHTTELLQLVSALPTSRYTRRIYLVSSGDKFSLNKAKQLESKLGAQENVMRAVQIPRARNVHQSFLTAPLTTAYSIAFCVYSVALLPLLRPQDTKRVLADVILMNGPGTCVPIVAAVYLLRILGLPSPKLMYIESFARVTSLSLTAKLVRPLVDRFVLQWPRQPPRESSANTVYSGWLI